MNKMLKMNHRDREILLSTPLMSGLNPALARRVLESAAVFGAEAKDSCSAKAQKLRISIGSVRLYPALPAVARGQGGRYRRLWPRRNLRRMRDVPRLQIRLQRPGGRPVTLARFDVAKIRQIMAEEPEFSMALLRVLAHHLQDARENVANDRLHTAPQRVANYLLEMLQASAPATPIPSACPSRKASWPQARLAPEALSRAFSMLKTSACRSAAAWCRSQTPKRCAASEKAWLK